jgi:NhaP-type Na+/H+ or K+/H+ antiporter
MENDTLMFAAIFLVAISVICAGVVMVAMNRVGHASKARLQKRRTGYTHRSFKDVV